MAVSGHTGVTKEGYENQFGTNYIGHAPLLKLLTPLLLQTAEESEDKPHVVFTSSKSHAHAVALPRRRYCLRLAQILPVRPLRRKQARSPSWRTSSMRAKTRLTTPNSFLWLFILGRC
jgi:NAD(P)-dependent dehydrogenase (short-subunit alcohol dehydrogenase family)